VVGLLSQAELNVWISNLIEAEARSPLLGSSNSTEAVSHYHIQGILLLYYGNVLINFSASPVFSKHFLYSKLSYSLTG